MDSKILSASANTGTGLLTSICVVICNLLGTESQNYKAKQQKVLNEANRELLAQFKKLGAGYKMIDYRVTWSGKLSVTVSALAEPKIATSAVVNPIKSTEPKVEKPVISKDVTTGVTKSTVVKKEVAKSETAKCLGCGATIKKGMLYCENCERKF